MGGKKIDIRVILDGSVAEKFRIIKETLGLENNTDLIRLLIHEKYLEILKEKDLEERLKSKKNENE